MVRAMYYMHYFCDMMLNIAKLLANGSIALDQSSNTGLILGLHPATERHRYKVTPSLIGWAQT